MKTKFTNAGSKTVTLADGTVLQAGATALIEPFPSRKVLCNHFDIVGTDRGFFIRKQWYATPDCFVDVDFSLNPKAVLHPESAVYNGRKKGSGFAATTDSCEPFATAREAEETMYRRWFPSGWKS